jgi:hypothetical protein
MAVTEARRKIAVIAGRTGEKLGDGVGVAREKLGEGREVAGRQLKVAGAAAKGGLATAATKVRPRVETARERSGTAIRKTRRKVGYWVAGEKPPSRTRRIGTGVLAGAAGAALAFFLDPVSGKRRRSVARDWVAARARGLGRRGGRVGRYMGSTAQGVTQRLRHGGEQAPENDQVLAHKVESELFQGSDFPKGQININAENGTVVLRGEVQTPDQIKRIEGEVRRIQGVRDVENLLHVPGQPAPMR